MGRAGEVPSGATRRLIRLAVEAGTTCEETVRRFRHTALRCRDAFDAEVEGLRDEDYGRLEDDSGLRSVLDAADRMVGVLSEVAAA